MYKDTDEEMVCCPYNRYHVVSKLRIQKHIIKCQKNNPDVKLVTCFYNYTHRLKPEDMLKHYEICSHKTRVDGARYYEPGSYNSVDSSMKYNDRSFNFPKTPVKTQKDFCHPCQLTSKTDFKYKRNFKPSNSENEGEESPPIMDEGNLTEADFHASANDDDDNDDLQPLPLPKTVSKAFTCIKQQQQEGYLTNVFPPKTTERGFGRAKNILTISPPRTPRATDNLLPDLTDMEIFQPDKKTFKFFSRSGTTSCSESVVSSMFDNTTTLKSQDITFDDDYDCDYDYDDSNFKGDSKGDGGGDVNAEEKILFCLKDFDDYVKIKL